MPKIKAEIQKVQIKNSSELKEILNLDFDIYIPEFEEIIELTQKELDELREKIILHKENKDLLKEIITEIIETKKITIFSLSGLMQDGLREGVEKEQRIENLQSSQDQEIESIDISKGIEVQKQNLKTLGMGLMFLLQELAIKGVKKEELSSLKNFKDLFLSYQDKISIQTKKVGEKFIEILSSDNKELKEFITLNWKKNIKKVYSQVQDIEDIYKNISEGKKIPDGNKIIKFFEKNKKNILLGAIILVGIYGLYKIGSLFFGKKEKKEGKEKKGFFTGKIGKLFGLSLSLFGLGQLVGIESIKDFFKEKFEFDIDENKFFKAIELFIDGKWFAGLHVLAKGTEVLNEGEENNSFYKKVAEEINKTKYAKNLDGGMKWKAIKSVGSEKTKELTSWLDYIIKSTKNLLPFADNEEKKQVDALVGFIKEKKEEMKLKIKKNDTVDMTLKQIMGEDPSSSQPQEKQDGSSQENMSGDTNEESEQRGDRTLFARVSQFSAKAKYYDGLYDKYLKYKGLDVGGKRLQKMRKIYEVGQFTKQEKGYLYEMIKLEEKGGIQKIFSDLQNETDPKKAKLLKKEIEGYIKNYEKFESFFSIYVRNMRSKPSFLDENIDSYKKFEVLKAKEVDLGEEIHNISKAYDEKILNLRKTETDTKLLEKKEAEAKKRFNDELYGKNGKVTELRNVQKSMLEELSIISTGDSLKSREFVNKNIGRFKTKVLPGGKVGLALLGLTVGSVALEGIKQEDFNKELMLAGGEAVGGFVPFVNVGLDFRQILSGEDLAGRKLSGIERWAMAPTFLVLDTVGSIATATGIGAVAGVPILIGSNALKGAKGAKMLKTAKEVEQVAKNTHTSKGIVEQQKLMEKLRKQGLHIIGSAQDVSRIPGDIIFKYQEGMKLAYNSGLLKAASPLMSVSKIGIYGGLGYSVITGIGETGNLILEKTNPILEFLKELV